MNMPAAQSPYRPGGLRGLLLPDHNDRLELMIDEILLHWESSPISGPLPVWERFRTELEEHLRLEEKWVFPSFEVAYPRDAASLRSNHTQLRALATKVESERALQTRAAPSLLALQKLLRTHALTEDKLFHPWAVENLDAEGWKAVRAALRALMFNVSNHHERENP
jgi:hypothetical protein